MKKKKKVLDIGPSGFLAPQGEKSKRILYPEPSPTGKELLQIFCSEFVGHVTQCFFLFFSSTPLHKHFTSLKLALCS
jgi:hypothetical protein